MDVEGAEWDSLESAAAGLLGDIDQLVLELHGVDDEQFLRVIERLKETFVVAHLHFNNFGCREDLARFRLTPTKCSSSIGESPAPSAAVPPHDLPISTHRTTLSGPTASTFDSGPGAFSTRLCEADPS